MIPIFFISRIFLKKCCPADTGQHELKIYIIRRTASGLSPFLEIETIKTEAVKSISSHNGYKYKSLFIKKEEIPQ
jgi:hypothetical protein